MSILIKKIHQLIQKLLVEQDKNVRINVTLRRVRITIVVFNKYHIF
jgi:ATP-dependent protease HslVU (ClpYQ) peptidase subunit